MREIDRLYCIIVYALAKRSCVHVPRVMTVMYVLVRVFCSTSDVCPTDTCSGIGVVRKKIIECVMSRGWECEKRSGNNDDNAPGFLHWTVGCSAGFCRNGSHGSALVGGRQGCIWEKICNNTMYYVIFRTGLNYILSRPRICNSNFVCFLFRHTDRIRSTGRVSNWKIIYIYRFTADGKY